MLRNIYGKDFTKTLFHKLNPVLLVTLEENEPCCYGCTSSWPQTRFLPG